MSAYRYNHCEISFPNGDFTGCEVMLCHLWKLSVAEITVMQYCRAVAIGGSIRASALFGSWRAAGLHAGRQDSARTCNDACSMILEGALCAVACAGAKPRYMCSHACFGGLSCCRDPCHISCFQRLAASTPQHHTFLLKSLHLTALTFEVIFCRGLAALRQALSFISSW